MTYYMYVYLIVPYFEIQIIFCVITENFCQGNGYLLISCNYETETLINTSFCICGSLCDMFLSIYFRNPVYLYICLRINCFSLILIFNDNYMYDFFFLREVYSSLQTFNYDTVILKFVLKKLQLLPPKRFSYQIIQSICHFLLMWIYPSLRKVIPQNQLDF